jgi:hypothetical protein
MHPLYWPFDGHGGALVQDRVHCPMEEVQGFGRSHWTPYRATILSNNMKGTNQHWFLLMFFIVNTLKMAI